MADSLITAEVEALIGQETEPERNRFPVSEEMAFDVADAIQDPNPLYVDPAYAQRSRYGGILCPPLATWKDIGPPIGYFGAGQESHFQVPLPFDSYGLNGGADWQFLRPVYAGADQIYLDAKVEDYIVDIVFATREPAAYKLEKLEKLIEYGASPRASIYLAQAARVQAFMSGRGYVTPQDVKTIGPDVLRHRILVSYEAEAQDLTSDDLIQEIFNTVDVP